MRRWIAAVAAGVLIVGLGLGLGGAFYGRLKMQRVLQQAQRQVTAADRIPFDIFPLAKPSNGAIFQPIVTPAGYIAGATAHGELWLAGAGGVAMYSSAATVPRLLVPGADLPPAPIVALATGVLRGEPEPQVIAATGGEGLLFFAGDGRARQLLPRAAPARDITALLPLGSGDLLLGTRKLGVLVYRGPLQGSGDSAAANGALQPFAPGLRGLDVTALAGSEGDLWIGTRNRGLLHWHGGELNTFDTSAGLPDPQIESLAVTPGRAFAGTPRGVAEFRDGRFAGILAPDLFAHALALDGDHLLVGTIDQGVREISLSPVSVRPGRSANSWPPDAEIDGFFAGQGKLFAITPGALLEHDSPGSWTPVLGTPPAPLSSRNIAALDVGPDGRLWIGYFNRGLDVWDAASDHAQHLEDDHLFCINRIVNDPLRHTVDVATANGLALFDPGASPLRARAVLLRRDGLIADHVTDIAFAGDTTVLATPAGLTFLSPHGAESLYAFEGLVNNHVYTLAAEPTGGRLLAGTLGGLSLLEGEQVRLNLTVANSGLKHNWITALLPAAPQTTSQTIGSAGHAGYLVGTYGAGVMAMDAAGHVSAIEGATLPLVVNPNAMLRTATHVFAGTLSGGLLMFDLSKGRWTRLTAGLPSLNVTSLAAANGMLYVGTENGLERAEEARLTP